MIIRVSLEIEVPSYANPMKVQQLITDMVGYELPDYKVPWNISTRELVSFQGAADALSAETNRSWSRQGVAQTWNRRSVNGFPEKHVRMIDGVKEEKLDKDEVLRWWRNHNVG
jgi:hypothetical protein